MKKIVSLKFPPFPLRASRARKEEGKRRKIQFLEKADLVIKKISDPSRRILSVWNHNSGAFGSGIVALRCCNQCGWNGVFNVTGTPYSIKLEWCIQSTGIHI